ncbi:hypothetical protein MHYP_G00206090 [Metynnis hypsauchen]
MSHYTTSVYENTATKALLTRLQAIDPDLGESRKVVYSLVDSADGFFSIDKSSGVVALERPMDREIQSLYVITVQSCLTRASLCGSRRSPTSQSRSWTSMTTRPSSRGATTWPRYPRTSPWQQRCCAFMPPARTSAPTADIYYSIRSGNQQGHFTIDVQHG